MADAEPADTRPYGMPIPRDQLRVGDLTTVTVEAEMMGEPTGVFLTVEQVVYRGPTAGRHRFDSEIESHYFSDREIVKVVLVDPD